MQKLRKGPTEEEKKAVERFERQQLWSNIRGALLGKKSVKKTNNYSELKDFLEKNSSANMPSTKEVSNYINQKVKEYGPSPIPIKYPSGAILVGKGEIAILINNPLFGYDSKYEDLTFATKKGKKNLKITINLPQIQSQSCTPYLYYFLDGRFQGGKILLGENKYYIRKKEKDYTIRESKSNQEQNPEKLELILEKKLLHLIIGKSGKSESFCIPETMNIKLLLDYCIKRIK